MTKFIDLIKTHQEKIVLIAGFILVAAIAFWLGRMTAFKYAVPEIKLEQSAQVQVSTTPDNYTPNVAGIQTSSSPANSAPVGNCEGKIKGSSSHIYHIPGDSFYKKTTHPIACFDTESQAQAAGFRKSAR